jgi:hydroxyethylthiazole kinase-like uncharacterized protein yjeF
LRAGGGLVTLFVKEEVYPVLAAACPPEVMVRCVADYREALDESLDVLAIGPGLGRGTEAGADASPGDGHRRQVLDLIARWPKPMVVDADALNLLATYLGVLENCAGPRLLTPHPGEMARLMPPPVPASARAELARTFAGRHGVTLLLKGARTVIAESGQPLLYNSTGTPGMGTGGMGDVLTGVTAALAALDSGARSASRGGGGVTLRQAAALGAWTCGRAAELALSGGTPGHSEESLLPTDLLDHLGAAFRQLRRQSC